MRYIKCLMAFVLMFSMMGWASAVTTLMNGGSAAINDESGGASDGYAYSFYNDGGKTTLQADILAIASTTGIGSVKVETKVPTYVSRTVNAPGNPNPDYALTVGADGTVTASVEGTTSDADVTSVGQIHATAGTSGANDVWGFAWIDSAIGNEWIKNVGNSYSQGLISGKPHGSFYADATADGEAKYAAESEFTAVAPAQTASLSISGGVSGKTTIEGKVADDDAEIKGFVGAIDVYPITHWLPTGMGSNIYTGLQSVVASISPIAPKSYTSDDVPALVAMTSGAYAIYSQQGPSYSAAAVGNVIAVGAENDGIPADALTYVSGTGVGSNNAMAKVIINNVGDVQGAQSEYKTSATKSDTMTADARVYKALDAATAHALLVTGSVSGGAGIGNAHQNLQASLSLVNTFSGARRENAGSATDGSDRTWGESFITQGTWNTWAADLESGSLVSKSAASGNLIQEAPVSGMGSGTFLQYKKLNPAYANMLVAQASGSGSLVNTIFGVSNGVSKVDTQLVVADIMGPKAHSLGSSGYDGSGVSADLTNLHVEAMDTETASPFEPTYISTDLAKTKAYFWCDGTNDLQYNGPGITSTTPVFDPAGNGNFDANIMAYVPSPTQRESLTAIVTTQPSII